MLPASMQLQAHVYEGVGRGVWGMAVFVPYTLYPIPYTLYPIPLTFFWHEFSDTLKKAE